MISIRSASSEQRDENGEAEFVHVYPMFGRVHDVEHGLECWCHPVRDWLEPWVVLHNVEN